MYRFGLKIDEAPAGGDQELSYGAKITTVAQLDRVCSVHYRKWGPCQSSLYLSSCYKLSGLAPL